MRTLVIGDIHGGYRALKQVMSRCGYKLGEQLIFLGDYVDGWSESAEVIQHLIEIDSEATIKPIFLRGNHDDWCDTWMKTGDAMTIWVNQGGRATLDSYVRTGLNNEDHRKFFRDLHNYHVDEENRGFVHGGFVSRKGLGHEAHQSSYYWDRDMWELALAHDRNYDKGQKPEAYDEYFRENPHRYLKHKEVYIGHTTTCKYKCKKHLPEALLQETGVQIHVPMNRCNVWNVDTGGGFKGKLTVMDIDTKEFWQSDFLDELYPEEKGR